MAPSRGRLAVSRLTLTAFRNLETLTLAPEGHSVVLTGPNGVGKTSVLEAVSLLVPGRGLRQANLADVGRHEDPRPWAIAAWIEGGAGGPRQVGTGLDPDKPGLPRRLVRLDGKPAAGQTALSAIAQAVWLTPQQAGLFLEPASVRRKWLDRAVFGLDPAHAGRVSRYERLLRERVQVLRAPRGGDPTWLRVLEQQLAETGTAILAARQDMARRLSAATVAGGADFPVAAVRCEGAAEALLAQHKAVTAEQHWNEALEASRPRDADAGGAPLGPHRTEVAVTWVERGVPAARCSTGEQKALLAGLTLATARLLAAETGIRPLLLLDDVAALLDPGRRAALFHQLRVLDCQTWLTGTEPGLFEDLGLETHHLTLPLTPASATPPPA